MQISERGLELIKRHEKLKLQRYLDLGGRPTIGWGHLCGTGEENLTDCSPHEADLLLIKDVAMAERTVRWNLCRVGIPLSQDQFDALCSLTFNIGASAVRDSTLVRKIKSGDVAGAADEFARWNHCKGVVSIELTRRRGEERALFLSEPAGKHA
jgi:lysozyme